MILNATAEIIRKIDDEYITVGQSRCMKQETLSRELKRYGEERAEKCAVYVPDVRFDVCVGDYITFDGTLENALSVSSVTRYDYGSPQLMHTKIGCV